MNQLQSILYYTFPVLFLIVIDLSGLSLENAQGLSVPYMVQNTLNSTIDPLPFHESHQVAIVAPPLEEGRIYSGIVSFTASQPVEVVILHYYKHGQNLTSSGEPLSATFGNNEYAASVIKQFTEPSFNSGSFVFAGNALAFHNLEGKPFVVTYTLKGEISSLTN
jgi:hypothetical protein